MGLWRAGPHWTREPLHSQQCSSALKMNWGERGCCVSKHLYLVLFPLWPHQTNLFSLLFTVTYLSPWPTDERYGPALLGLPGHWVLNLTTPVTGWAIGFQWSHENHGPLEMDLELRLEGVTSLVSFPEKAKAASPCRTLSRHKCLLPNLTPQVWSLEPTRQYENGGFPISSDLHGHAEAHKCNTLNKCKTKLSAGTPLLVTKTLKTRRGGWSPPFMLGWSQESDVWPRVGVPGFKSLGETT